MNAEDKFREAMTNERIKKNISKSCLARKIKKSPSFICDIEACRKNPSINTMVDIAETLNISLDEIFFEWDYAIRVKRLE